MRDAQGEEYAWISGFAVVPARERDKSFDSSKNGLMSRQCLYIVSRRSRYRADNLRTSRAKKLHGCLTAAVRHTSFCLFQEL